MSSYDVNSLCKVYYNPSKAARGVYLAVRGGLELHQTFGATIVGGMNGAYNDVWVGFADHNIHPLTKKEIEYCKKFKDLSEVDFDKMGV